MAQNTEVLEERMKTMQAEYKTDIALLAKQIAERDALLVLSVAALLAVAVTILGLLIRLP